MSSRTSFRA